MYDNQFKKYLSSLLIITASLGLVSNANAELQSRLNGQAVYDTDLNITWLADANAGGRLSFSNAKQWVTNLSVDGISGWRLPDAKTTFNGTSHSLSEMGHLYFKELGAELLPYPPNLFDSTDPDLALFSNITLNYYWTENTDNNTAVAYSFSRGYQVQTYRTYRKYGAWAVHDGDVGNTNNTTTIYEDAEDQSTTRWQIYDTTPSGAIIRNVFDYDVGSHVIEFSGSATRNGYRLGHNNANNANAWGNTTEKVISWNGKFSEYFVVYIGVQTTQGFRYLYYTPTNTDRGINTRNTKYIHHGIGSTKRNGFWHTINRDLEADLKEYEPTNSIISVNGFLIRGSGRVDNISLLTNLPPPLPAPLTIMYENAENGNTSGWDVYDFNPSGAIISNVFDNEKNNSVIELNGDGRNNGYRLGHNNANNPKAWNNTDHKTISWDSKYTESFSVYLSVQTTQGFRYLYYTPADSNHGINSRYSKYIHHGLGSNRINGVWHTNTRDLEADLRDFEPTNSIISVNGFLTRGSGRVDNILMKQ